MLFSIETTYSHFYNNAYKQLRKDITNSDKDSIISLSQGIFKPYTGLQN